MTNLNTYCLSFIGRRDSNQDNCLALKVDDITWFLAVADGMGGSSGGETASKVVIEKAREIIMNRFREQVQTDDLKEILDEIYLQSQIAIAKEVKEDPSLTGMGTTLCCTLIHNNQYVYANIGDSRLYLLSKGDLRQLTKDHSLIQEYIDENGKEVPENLVKNYGHFITRSLNGEKDKPDIFPIDKKAEELKKGEIFLICSDGLITDKVNKNNNHFKNFILSKKSIVRATENLIADAYHRGSNDNITVLLAESGRHKRKSMLVPEYKYPPSQGDKPDNDQKINRYHTADKRIIRKILIPFVVVMIIGSLLYIFRKNISRIFDNKDKVEINDIGKNAVIIHSPTFQIDTNFRGFEKQSKTFFISRDLDEEIVWFNFDNPDLDKFMIVLELPRKEKDTLDDLPKNHTNIILKDLKINRTGR